MILLDSYLPSQRPSAAAIGHWAVRQARGLLRRRGTTAGGGRGLVFKLARLMAGGAPPAWIPRSQLAFAASMIKAGAAYKPARSFGPILMVKAGDRDSVERLFDTDGLLGWSVALKGDVVLASAPGGHHQFLKEPLVAMTALAISQFLLTYA